MWVSILLQDLWNPAGWGRISDTCALMSTCGHCPSCQYLVIVFLPPLFFFFFGQATLDYKSDALKNTSLNCGKAQPGRWRAKIQKTKLRNRFWKKYPTGKKDQEGARWTQVHTTSQGLRQDILLPWCPPRVFAHSSLLCKRRLIPTLLQNQILLDTDFWWEYFRN